MLNIHVCRKHTDFGFCTPFFFFVNEYVLLADQIGVRNQSSVVRHSSLTSAWGKQSLFCQNNPFNRTHSSILKSADLPTNITGFCILSWRLKYTVSRCSHTPVTDVAGVHSRSVGRTKRSNFFFSTKHFT